jgi:hypothetical protein
MERPPAADDLAAADSAVAVLPSISPVPPIPSATHQHGEAGRPAALIRASRTGEVGFSSCVRVTPVHAALRNCTRDEGRPFEFGNQVRISSHRKLLRSKG